jgi:7,8-dihydroneopterin aldolase/epimerase/oxygenase
MDLIFIHDLRLDILVGVYDWERTVPQTVQLDLDIALPAARPHGSDRIAETIDYAKVVARIERTLSQHRFGLLEALAEHVAELIITEFGAPWVRASVTKLGAIRNVKRLGITIERGSRS